jgi:hypothetical protein
MDKFADYKPIFDINMNDVIKVIMSYEEVKKSIIEYNQSQLQEGLDSHDKRIVTTSAKNQGMGEVYSSYTIKIKSRRGQDTENVTLEDSGDFYNSMLVKISDDNVEVIADFNKPDGNINDNFNAGEFDFLGLTDDNLEGFATWVLQDYLELELRKRLHLS